MWLTSFMAKNIKEQPKAATGFIAQTKDSQIALQTSSKHTDVPMVAPYGVVSVPPVGQQAVVLKTSRGEVCVGVVMPQCESLEEGEVMLCSKGASIVLKNDGRILMNGKEMAGA